MRKYVAFILTILFCLMLISCDIDPYKNRRPIEYENSEWVSKGENHEMYFKTGKMEDSKLIINNELIGSFYLLFSSFDDSVSVYKYKPNEEYTSDDLMFKGTCDFGRKKFKIEIISKSNISEELPDELIFERIS